MPSASLSRWRNDRAPRLTQIDAQCVACDAAIPQNAHLIDENFRGHIVLLSDHFQGSRRDLYSESAQIVASKVRTSLRVLVQ